MRLNEIKPLKHIKPLTPAQARLYKLKAGVEQSRTALKAERDSQKRKREMDTRYKSPTHPPTLPKRK